MNKWIQQIVFRMVISFILRQLSNFKDKVNWDLVEKDVEFRVRQIIPGNWFDEEAVKASHTLLSCIKRGLEETDKIEVILHLIAEERWDDAYDTLKRVVQISLEDKTTYSVAELELKNSFKENQIS